MMAHLMLHGEQSLFAPQPGEDAVAAAEQVSQTTKEWVNALADETGWPVTEADLDDVRQMAYHFAVGLDVNPEHVVALERKFVLETPDGTLSGKVDLASLPPDGTLVVDDYKSSFYVPADEDFSKMVQVPLYAVLLLWGSPVEKLADGTEVIGEPLGLEHVQWVRARQIYPRFLKNGTMATRERVIGRADLRDALEGAQRAMRRVKRGVEERVWPAVSGPHCSECTCEAECPLPRQLRRFAGAINDVEQASEAMEWAERQSSLVTATKREVRAFVKAHDQELGGELPVGSQTYALQVSFPRSVKKAGKNTDWDGLEAAIRAAAWDGAAFDLDDWVRRGTKTDFKVKKETE
jgi:hypothetical protein